MRELEIHREVQRREARRAVGYNPLGPRLTVGQVATAPLDASILALPINVDDRNPMQNAAGDFFFMFDFSAFDGPDTWA